MLYKAGTVTPISRTHIKMERENTLHHVFIYMLWHAFPPTHANTSHTRTHARARAHMSQTLSNPRAGGMQKKKKKDGFWGLTDQPNLTEMVSSRFSEDANTQGEREKSML